MAPSALNQPAQNAQPALTSPPRPFQALARGSYCSFSQGDVLNLLPLLLPTRACPECYLHLPSEATPLQRRLPALVNRKDPAMDDLPASTDAALPSPTR